MSLAIAHFTFGAAVTMLVVTFLLPHVRYPRVASVLGGIWAMVPDAHHVVPVYATLFKRLHDSVYVNLFWGHGFLDALDPSDSNEVALLGVAVFLAATVVAETAEYYFETPVQRTFRSETRAQSDVSSLGSALGGRKSGVRSLTPVSLVRAVRLVGGTFALFGGVGLHLLLLRTSSHAGLLAGLGALLEIQGAAAVHEDTAVASWASSHLPAGIRAGVRAGVVAVACLLALPLFLSLTTLTTLSVAHAAVGSLLVLTAMRL